MNQPNKRLRQWLEGKGKLSSDVRQHICRGHLEDFLATGLLPGEALEQQVKKMRHCSERHGAAEVQKALREGRTLAVCEVRRKEGEGEGRT
eukprot:gene1918-10022_t